MKFTVCNLTDLSEVADKWLELNPSPVICLLVGEMGSGKTTLVKMLCEKLGVAQGISSPTFSIVNEYETSLGSTVYHFDLYRLKNTEELYDMGFEEYLDQGNYVFVEWPELATPFFSKEEKKISLFVENQNREIEFS